MGRPRLFDLNEPQRSAVKTIDGPCSSWPERAPARPGGSPPGSPINRAGDSTGATWPNGKTRKTPIWQVRVLEVKRQTRRGPNAAITAPTRNKTTVAGSGTNWVTNICWLPCSVPRGFKSWS